MSAGSKNDCSIVILSDGEENEVAELQKEHKQLSNEWDQDMIEAEKVGAQITILNKHRLDGNDMQGMYLLTERIQDEEHFKRVASEYIEKHLAVVADVRTKRSRCDQIV